MSPGQDLFHQLPCPALVTDLAGNVLLCNAELLELIGSTAEKLHQRRLDDVVTPAGRIFLQTHVWPMLIREGKVDEIYLHLKGPLREPIPVLVNGRKGQLDGEGCYQWVFFIAQERLRFEAALLAANARTQRLGAELAEQHELLQVTMKSIGDGVITTDAAGRISWLNPVAERLTGWLAGDAAGLPVGEVFRVIHQETRAPAECPVTSSLLKGTPVELAENTLLVSREGAEVGIEDSAAPIRDSSGEMLGVVLVFRDVTAQRQISQEMAYQATHDALTGLFNRAKFVIRLRRLLQQTHDGVSSGHALLYIDLDQFKVVNDSCGHAAGDKLLQQVAKLLSSVVRAHDTVARLGGDEFALILEHCNLADAQAVGRKLCDQMESFRFVHGDRRFRIGASVGLVPIDRRWATTEAVVQAADLSCYAAKNAGRNRVHTWVEADPATKAQQEEMSWTTRIEQALDDERFVLYGQRIASLTSADPRMHVEVLLRMLDTDGSIIVPAAFLPAAERYSLACRIDKWVVLRTIAWMSAVPDLEALGRLNINLSGQSVSDTEFQAWAVAVLDASGTEVCSRLTLEITETAAMANPAGAKTFIDEIRRLGVRVALDDFGAGASSFGYLKTLHVDVVKIDGQFVREMVNSKLSEAAVRCFIEVAKIVGAETVAEHVDNALVVQRLRAMGVDYLQGYFVHRPEPLETLFPQGGAILRDWSKASSLEVESVIP